ncbi:Na+/H+ antiporter subunit G [Ectothiorhodospira lacustris]|uniref:Na+/H+ antiporter subunit G n=2 Tax=Ectothiorhodospira lacustris TaxID=2899127 RepID=UPI001EE91977|nr:Na+/H+ antiporter subunit G [Ectothiorhodospira lacustris]MCG5511356.1 Na+/H+ antiporter subunit G [Ectothiorhodospira lacustris]MCG5523142.1 Na+/H+ antiporter subunit G [Ectothiorhodospira lacustris]
MEFLLELVISLLIVIGGCFVIVGSVGLVKLPDLMSRLHAPTKATTLGVGGALVASMLYFWGIEGKVSIHEVLITGFLFLTAPVTAHFVAKAYLHRHPEKKTELPPTGRPYGWSTYDAPPDSTAGQAGDVEAEKKD